MTIDSNRRTWTLCHECNGRGHAGVWDESAVCGHCNGKGKVTMLTEQLRQDVITVDDPNGGAVLLPEIDWWRGLWESFSE